MGHEEHLGDTQWVMDTLRDHEGHPGVMEEHLVGHEEHLEGMGSTWRSWGALWAMRNNHPPLSAGVTEEWQHLRCQSRPNFVHCPPTSHTSEPSLNLHP